ncbi:MAG: lytic transglycosylase domain-containing protein [Burkholderiales bacterium]|nr:lytic transglycosylase domain-containing protein [Burkholderiales bacterium]
MHKISFPAAADLQLDAPRRVHRFYAALLALSLMLGKIVPAQAQVPPASPSTSSVTTANITPRLSAADRDVLAARAAFERRDLKALAAARDRLRNAEGQTHQLSLYAQYWWLSASLAQAGAFAVGNANEIRAFLAANPNSVVGESLRRDWLKILGKLEQWDLFSAEIALLTSEDAEITCHQWRHRLGRDERDALTEAKAFWNAARTAPGACDEVFARLMTRKVISIDEAWLRIRTLLENNQLADARKSAALIPGISANFERTTAVIGQNPAQFLQSEKLLPASRTSVELFLYAVTRLARTDSDRAATLLEAHGKKLPADELAYAWAQVGLYGGMQHDIGTLAWFERAGTFRLTDTQAGWKARAAMRAHDWPTVRAAINAMSELERRDAAWRYWLSRASQQTGDLNAARTLRETLAKENSFYGVLSAEELGMQLTPNWLGWKPSRAEIDTVMQRPAIKRALAFYALELKTEGLREWLYGIRNMDDQELLAAAEAARMANVPDRAINTAEKTLAVHDFKQRFPTPHQTDLTLQARAQGLDEAWVYGLIRQESRFMADAKSRAGAMGLMQLMPATATWAAKKVSMNHFSLTKVNDVPINLNLGSFYLRHVLDDLGHPVLATAGYNAGPGRARRWRATQALEGAIYAESIPFTETRDYVKKVMVNAWFYAHQAGVTTRRLKEMMGTVPGSSEGGTGVSSLASVALKHKAQ